MKSRPPEDARRILIRLQRDIAKLGALVDDVAAEVPETPWSFSDWALVLNALDRSGDHVPGLTQQLATVRDAVKHQAAKSYPRGEPNAVVEGAGVLELCSAGAKDVWAGPLLVRTLAARCADEGFDRTTGEALPPGVLAEKVAETIIDVAGLDTASQTFRKGKVTSYGLVPGEFYERSNGTLSIKWAD